MQDGSAFSIMGFVNAKHGRKWLYYSREERQRAVREHLTRSIKNSFFFTLTEDM